MDIQPRTTAEILDDAVRLALADASLLLAFSCLFQAPAFLILLLLWARPAPEGPDRFLLPALAALLLPVTGLASGACQDLFRRRAEVQPVSLRRCLTDTLAHGLEHAAARSLVLAGILIGLALLAMPGLGVWTACTSVHALIADGKGRSGAILQELGREARFDPSKAAMLTLCRILLLVLAAVNLHLVVVVALWIAGNMAGLDTALLELQASLGNPLYRWALLLLTWLLLTPAFEATSFLLHLDVRTRQEGLDLLYRVRRFFPSARRVALVLGFSLVLASPGVAQDQNRDSIRTPLQRVRETVSTIRTEVKAADPFPGAGRWQGRLQSEVERLERASPRGGQRLRWLSQAVQEFGKVDSSQDALRALDRIDIRLALLEQSLGRQPHDAKGQTLTADEVKAQLRRTPAPHEARSEERPAEETKKEPARRDDARPERTPAQPQRQPDAVSSGPSSNGTSRGLVIVGGVALAILLAFLLLWLSSRRDRPARPASVATSGQARAQADPEPHPSQQSPAILWKLSETLAQQGRYLDALRALYRAVLGMLHHHQILRYEPTRTNGEYLEQVQRAYEEKSEVPQDFSELTNLFERKWYGEHACDSTEYRQAALVAERIRSEVGLS